jgi:hypothetical protein
MHVEVVLDVRDGVFNRLFAGFNLSDILLNWLLGHLRNTDKEICEQLELCFKLILLTYLVSRGVDMLRACLNRAQDNGFEGR